MYDTIKLPCNITLHYPRHTEQDYRNLGMAFLLCCYHHKMPKNPSATCLGTAVGIIVWAENHNQHATHCRVTAVRLFPF